jgi:hypothetical protein
MFHSDSLNLVHVLVFFILMCFLLLLGLRKGTYGKKSKNSERKKTPHAPPNIHHAHPHVLEPVPHFLSISAVAVPVLVRLPRKE